MSVKIGIVIPVHNCLNYTLSTVNSIRSSYPYQIFIVDDHSDAPTREWLATQKDFVVIYDPPDSTGLAFNWNVGIRAALVDACSHILVTNNDVVFHPAAIENMVKRIDRQDVVLVSCFDIRDRGASLENLTDFPVEDVETLAPNFCCFMITGRTLSTVGWFDERFHGAYVEDSDYYADILMHGEQAISTLLAPIYHFGSRTLAENSDIAPRIHQAHRQNRAYFIGKWGQHPSTILSNPPQLRERSRSMRQNAENFATKKRVLHQFFTHRLFLYNRVGYDSRPMTFRPDHFIGQGAAGCEAYWGIHDDAGEAAFDIAGDGGTTCTLKEDDKGVWRGQWSHAEQMPVELSPLPIKLDIGSGGKACPALGEGWLGLDAFCPDADIQAQLWELPYEDGTVDEIFSMHTLEHISKAQVPIALREWCRVLKLGGTATIRVPDLEWCCRHWLSHQTTGWDIDVLFGNQNHAGEFHKTGFNEAILLDYVNQAGFKVTRFERLETHGQMTLSVECIKRNLIDHLYRQAVQTPSDINEHVSTLCNLGTLCDHITEFCARTLESTIAFLYARPKEFFVYNTEMLPPLAEINTAAQELPTEVHFCQADSLSIVIEPTDLLFLDNIHIYSYIKDELQRHARKVKKFIVFHDTTIFGEQGDRNGEVGIWPAIQEFLVSEPEWTIRQRFENNNGLTILERR